jgi:hypothetical protein
MTVVVDTGKRASDNSMLAIAAVSVLIISFLLILLNNLPSVIFLHLSKKALIDIELFISMCFDIASGHNAQRHFKQIILQETQKILVNLAS